MRALFLILFLSCPLSGTAFAGSATLCNSGSDPFLLATREEYFGTDLKTVAGWSTVNPGECWTRKSNKQFAVDYLISYLDQNGKVGSVGKERLSDASFMKDFGVLKKDKRYCIDAVGRFERDAADAEELTCPSGLSRAKFSVRAIVRTSTNLQASVVVDTSVAHERDRVFFPDEDLDEPAPMTPLEEETLEQKTKDLQSARAAAKEGNTGDAVTKYLTACVLLDEACAELIELLGNLNVSADATRHIAFLTLVAEHGACYRTVARDCASIYEFEKKHGKFTEQEEEFWDNYGKQLTYMDLIFLDEASKRTAAQAAHAQQQVEELKRKIENRKRSQDEETATE